MSLATLIPLAIQASIMLTVFCLGLKASPQEVTYLFRRPGLLLRSLLSMNIITALIAAALVAAFDLHPAVKIALMALSVSPVPPLFPKKALKAGGEASFTVSLLVTAGLIAIVIVPFAVKILGGVYGASVSVPATTIIKIVGITIVIPLLAGLLASRIAPALSDKSARPLSVLAAVLLIVSAVPIVFATWRAMVSLIGNGTLAAMIAFVLAGLLAGHLLGGPDPKLSDRAGVVNRFPSPRDCDGHCNRHLSQSEAGAPGCGALSHRQRRCMPTVFRLEPPSPASKLRSDPRHDFSLKLGNYIPPSSLNRQR